MFLQVNSSFVKFPRNFVLVIGTICWLSYVMSVSEIDLLLAVNCIESICIGDQTIYVFWLGKTTIICLVFQMWVKEAITQLQPQI